MGFRKVGHSGQSNVQEFSKDCLVPAAVGDIDPLSSSDFVVVYSSMALFQIEPELDLTGGLGVAMFAKGADEFITGSSATVFA